MQYYENGSVPTKGIFFDSHDESILRVKIVQPIYDLYSSNQEPVELFNAQYQIASKILMIQDFFQNIDKPAETLEAFYIEQNLKFIISNIKRDSWQIEPIIIVNSIRDEEADFSLYRNLKLLKIGNSYYFHITS